MFSNTHVATKHEILKRDLFTGSWNIIHQMTRTKSENIKNIERRFSVDIDKITTDQPFNMTLLLEMMSKLVHTYKLTLATLPTGKSSYKEMKQTFFNFHADGILSVLSKVGITTTKKEVNFCI